MNISAWTHFAATILSIAGLVVLITLGAMKGTAAHIVAFTIFGSSLILLYLASTLYHFLSHEHGAKRLFRFLDHSMIYVLIAGTYTPVALLVLPTGWGWSIFGVIWGLALMGIIMKALHLPIPPWAYSLNYLVMGWLIVIAFIPLREAVPGAGLFSLVLGGVFYTVGTFFFALDAARPRQGWWSYHDVFHLLVMAGSLSHFWFMFSYVLPS